MPVRVDRGLMRRVRIVAAHLGTSISGVIEEAITADLVTKERKIRGAYVAESQQGK